MGDWQHPAHYTETAQRFEEASRTAQIGLFMEMCFPRVREAARSCGYALAVHGTLRRDLDLIAVPWTDRAVSSADLVKAVAAATRDTTGWGHPKAGDWTEKPHGRVATTIIASAEVHIDLSVMPREPKAETAE